MIAAQLRQSRRAVNNGEAIWTLLIIEVLLRQEGW
jgi:hypothetical protein